MTDQPTLIEAIDATLPQTQCGKCGHDGCRPYAEAIAEGEPINRCPPGGDETVVRLAELTGRSTLPLEQPAQSPLVARIREDECIGCTKCIQACPVDAILGAAKQMHTVIESECTGCELCVAPCPVDCIDLLPHPEWQAASDERAQRDYLAKRATLGRQRHDARNRRLARQAEEKRRRRAERQAQRAAPANKPAEAATTSSASLRTTRVSLLASLKRVDRQRQDASLADADRRDLERRAEELRSRLADIDRQLAEGTEHTARPASSDRQRRFAVNAAEQARRRARQQLAHAQRQGDDKTIEAARDQLARAERMLEQAREALAPPSH
ncbi:RnfABCDGE type electron transport complex subunit B [Halomonas elongata]|uniref:Electron transport complex subunit RnfB n=1 Tax=Halomonas elongata (strain ATCC 33173 / DSM 2581 / NBRC 15536 / NCIMB 2198 / 1H9) TaxID=768066 RepID=E1V3D4_HALED|nr:RnfABCDGE type electron transport complex subunit B [Halomonas elongata]WBF19909.1 RnfABCDGE type electron transport complex subunit B [Halomonas elongata]WPU48778.1 RnfABCDGE type electron transport complex subunit B [Halomonas elongata DSM 2581]CBV42613.1 electron transport complex subunit RnfB [Halomonas elongata DSM 2581]